MSGKNFRAGSLALAICASAGLGACDTGEQEDAVQAGVESLAVANPAIGGLSDPNILAVLDGIHTADSASGALASTKGTDRDVRAYGQMMVTEHHDMRVEGSAVAGRVGITPALPTNDPAAANQTAAIALLEQAPKGQAFDRAYIAQAVRMHEEALGTARNAVQSTRNAEIRTLTEKAIPAIERHLNRAREIQQRIGGKDSTAAGADTSR